MVARALQHDRNSGDVITPMISWRDAILQIYFHSFGEIRGMQYQLAVIAGSDSDPNVECDRSRHHETVVVVGMFPDKIHSARSPIDTCPAAVTLAEFLLQIGCNFGSQVLNLNK